MPGEPLDVLHHLALAADWEVALGRGSYEISTLGHTLAEVGFIHLSFPHQLARVAEAFYRDVAEPLVQLTIDPTALTSPVRLEPADPTDPASELFPHLYGPLPVGAVVEIAEARFEEGRFVVG